MSLIENSVGNQQLKNDKAMAGNLQSKWDSSRRKGFFSSYWFLFKLSNFCHYDKKVWLKAYRSFY